MEKKLLWTGLFSLVLIVFTSGSVMGQYLETFSTPNKGYLVSFVDDFAGVNWTLSTWNTAGSERDTNDYFQTTAGGVLEAIDLDQEVCWTSPPLTVIATGTSAFTANISWTGFDVNQTNPLEFINVEYQLNGGAWVRHPNIIGANGDPAYTMRPTGGATPQAGTATTNFPSIAVTAGNTIQVRVCFSDNANAEVTTLDNVSVTNAMVAPTAASVSLGGRVFNSNGSGIGRAQLTLVSTNGQVRTAISNGFGYYNFDGLQSGGTYTLTINSKEFQFAKPSRIINLDKSLSDVDFEALP